MTVPNITATVAKGFGSGVGGFSNTATILYAMAAIFDKPGHEDQHATIMNRIKLLREIVGQEIDRIKGADKPYLPKAWKSFQAILPEDTPEERTRKMRQNAMIVSKKPYFFRYLYPELNQKFKQFEDSYNQISRDLFGAKFKKLLKKEDRTEDENELVKRYRKYCPLITAPCTMNVLCRQFEDIDFDIKFDKRSPNSMLPTFESELSGSFSQAKLDAVRSMYRDYVARKRIKALGDVLSPAMVDPTSAEYREIRSSAYDAMLSDLRGRLSESGISSKEFLFYCSRLAKSYASFNWAFPWDVLDEAILKLIPTSDPCCPIRDPLGDHEYLGLTYSLRRLDPDAVVIRSSGDPETDVLVARLMTAIFGIPTLTGPGSRSAEKEKEE